jgi:hypothetical protein
MSHDYAYQSVTYDLLPIEHGNEIHIEELEKPHLLDENDQIW